jgi:multidrug efflux system outer membrane protein
MNRNVALNIILGFAMAGCTLNPQYSRPPAPIPDQWPASPAYSEATDADGELMPADLEWREFVADARLVKVIEIALASNRDLRVAALNVERVRALYDIQRAQLYPIVNATGGAVRQKASGDFTSAGQSRISKAYEVNLGAIAWEVDFFGRIRSLADQALEEFMATQQARHSTQILLVSSVAQAYFTLAASREALSLSQRTFQTQKEAFDIVSRQYDVGLATELDLRRAQTPVEIARGDIARYTQLAAEARNALVLLIGSSISEDLLSDELDQISPQTPVAAGLSSDVLLRRPDIVAAEHRLRGAYAQIGAARAAFFPRISLTSTIGAASVELSNLFASGNGAWTYGATIVMPIFDPRTWAAHRVTKVEQEIALAQYERAIQTAFREVADALAVRGTIDERVAAQQALVDALQETHRLSMVRYERGIDSYLGVLDAQRSLFDAQQGLIALRLLQRVSQDRLYAVLGGGWRPEEVQAAVR